MDILNGLADRGEWLVAGLVGAIISGWWHKAGLLDWRAWLVFLVTGVWPVQYSSPASPVITLAWQIRATLRGLGFCWDRSAVR